MKEKTMFEVIEYAYHSGAPGCRGYMSQRVVGTAETYDAATALKVERKAQLPKDTANNEFLLVISEVK
jgi:hypothetical protein